MKNELKQTKALTLIALVITIIVLLILAGVTVSTLTGDNGLLTKAGNAKEKNTEAEICEQIKLAYGEYQVAKYDNTDKTAEKIIEDSLRTTYGGNITKVKVKNEKVTVNMLVNNQSKTYIYKTNTGETFEYKDSFDYGDYTKENIPVGKDIILGAEKFKVFYNQDGVIKAMPRYNIELNLDNPIQSSSAENIKFSSSVYWEKGDDINMLERNNDNTGYKNNIQKYIEAYGRTLENLGAEDIEVRIGRYSELSSVGTIIRTANSYWVGTASSSDEKCIYTTNDYMFFSKSYYATYGVRPIIIIEY